MNNLKIMQTGILKYLMMLAVSCCLTSSFVVSQEDETIGIESVTTKNQEEIDRELQQELERIQAAYEEETLEEFTPSESLSADVAVSFPSDI